MYLHTSVNHGSTFTRDGDSPFALMRYRKQCAERIFAFFSDGKRKIEAAFSHGNMERTR